MQKNKYATVCTQYLEKLSFSHTDVITHFPLKYSLKK